MDIMPPNTIPTQSGWCRPFPFQEVGEAIVNHTHIWVDECGYHCCQEDTDNRIEKHRLMPSSDFGSFEKSFS